MKYINVIIENKSRHTDNFFTYRTDCDDICVGAKVLVPFGPKDRPREGLFYLRMLSNDFESLLISFKSGF